MGSKYLRDRLGTGLVTLTLSAFGVAIAVPVAVVSGPVSVAKADDFEGDDGTTQTADPQAEDELFGRFRARKQVWDNFVRKCSEQAAIMDRLEKKLASGQGLSSQEAFQLTWASAYVKACNDAGIAV